MRSPLLFHQPPTAGRALVAERLRTDGTVESIWALPGGQAEIVWSDGSPPQVYTDRKAAASDWVLTTDDSLVIW